MENFYEHIDDYMNGLLTGDKLQEFKAEMEANPSLRKAVENYDAAKKISESLLEVDMMETLSRLKEEKGRRETEAPKTDGPEKDNTESQNGNGATVRKLNIRKWIAAASFIGIIALAGWWVMEWNDERVYKEYVLSNVIRPYDEDATKSVELDTIGLNNFQIGKAFFSRNRFEESIPWFEKYVAQNLNEEELSEGYEWLGAALLYSWKFEEAKAALQKSNRDKARQNLSLINQRDK